MTGNDMRISKNEAPVWAPRERSPAGRERSPTPPPPPELPSPDSTFTAEPGELEIFCTDFEILPPPTPNSELEEEEPHNGHQDTMMEEEKPPITPEPEERREPLVRQDSKDSTGSREDYKIRRPSTIFSPSGDGSVVSPWGPPTKSMKKKKGWIEPEKPVTVKPKQEIKKIVADTNELFNVFERRNKGESISKSITDKDAPRTDEKAISEIGGNIHMRISFSQPATLHVEVKQADDLVVSIKNKTCNPYAVVTLLGEYEVFKTEVVTKSQSPVWNQTFDFALPLKFLQTTAVLVVLYNKHGESHEEFLGEVHISLAAYKHFKVIDSWYALEDLRGEEAKFDGYKELQKVLRSLKTKAPMSLPDTLRQDELRKEENFNSY